MLSFTIRRKIAISSLKKYDIDIKLLRMYNPKLLTDSDAVQYLQQLLDDSQHPDPIQLAAAVLRKRLDVRQCAICAKMMLGLNEKSTKKAYKTILDYIKE
ncbi:hypothetical protein SS50377_22007 [Spironucleus salmonicida]|uniref:Uncharacterized protein n=1 Tax=Spironucleus salmonicida TaxID=348837 RepID=V6LNL1_9EUKA|nr:hypothetical protein SS50377_22007 [Spironucleus salmonicida]|eukprot:EST45828.1 Hypothetical protein SS50377_14403 [Spironucleus salmonicida]